MPRAYEIAPIGDDEYRVWVETFLATLGVALDDDDLERYRPGVEFDRTLAVRDGGRIVATTRAISFTLTLPGGAQVPVAGATAVGVLPTHRRRGIASALMGRHLDDARARGEVASVLLASEGAIYGRFGYGAAVWLGGREIDTGLARLRPGPPDTGRLRLLDGDEARASLPVVYERVRAERAGFLDRTAHAWDLTLADTPSRREGASALQIALHEDESGRPDGYALYRIKQHWLEDTRADHKASLTELVAATPEATRALWELVLSLDLVRTVKVDTLAVDDPLPWMLEDPRAALPRGPDDLIWLRPMDVPALLAQRTYAAPGRLVLEVIDRFRPADGGRFLLDAGAGGAECRRTDDAPDLVLDVRDLGSLLLGGADVTQLAAADRVVEASAGAVDRAGAMLRSPAPWCVVHF